MYAPGCQQCSRHPSSEGKQQAFGQQLTNDATATSTQCGAKRKLFYARTRSREQQIGNVGAADEEHECNGAPQDKQGTTCRANYLLREWNKLDVRANKKSRVLLLESLLNCVHLRCRLCHGYSGLETTNDVQRMTRALTKSFSIQG